MAIRQLPVVGRPMSPPARPRKIALEKHIIDPGLVTPNWDSSSGELGEQGSSYAGFNPDYADSVNARLHDLHESRIEEMDAAASTSRSCPTRSAASKGSPTRPAR
jgi:hypothetical protein